MPKLTLASGEIMSVVRYLANCPKTEDLEKLPTPTKPKTAHFFCRVLDLAAKSVLSPDQAKLMHVGKVEIQALDEASLGMIIDISKSRQTIAKACRRLAVGL